MVSIVQTMGRVGRLSGVASRTVVVGLLLVAGLPAQALPLVSNGSFSDPGALFVPNAGPGVMQLGNGDTSISGWNVIGGINRVAQPDGIAWETGANPQGLQPSVGSYFVNLGGADGTSHYGGITLSSPITTVPGDTYILTFDFGSCSLASGDAVNPVLKVLVSGIGCDYYTGNNAVAQTTWTTETLQFQATSTATFITFNNATGLSYVDSLVGLDNVGVVHVPPVSPAVPEAKTTLIGALALVVVLGVLGRRSPASKAAL